MNDYTCGCENGENCTKTTVCHVESVVQDIEDAHEIEIERLRDPDWKTYIDITSKWLEKYPPDIFTGVSGDPGPLCVVAVRAALEKLDDN